MSTSYDSVTQKRRPAVRAFLAITAVVVIFGASISAASEVDVAPVIAVVDEAAFVLPTTSSSTTSTTLAPTTEAPPATVVEPASAVVDSSLVDSTQIDSIAMADPVAPAGVTVGSGFGIIEADRFDASAFGRGDASDSGTSNTIVAEEALATEVLELVSTVEERDRQIVILSEQVSALREAETASEAVTGPIADVSALAAKERLTSEENAAALDLWLAGYTLGGGSQWSSFRDVILPCESGSQPNPDTAVGRTDDWGRSQINRPVWKTRFESLTGVNFEIGIVNPTLNGFMAAHVEQEQGLTAWTCWRNR